MPRRLSESLVTKRKDDETLSRPARQPFERQVEASLREHADLLNLTHDAMFVRDMKQRSSTGTAAPRRCMDGRLKRRSASPRPSC